MSSMGRELQIILGAEFWQYVTEVQLLVYNMNLWRNTEIVLTMVDGKECLSRCHQKRNPEGYQCTRYQDCFLLINDTVFTGGSGITVKCCERNTPSQPQLFIGSNQKHKYWPLLVLTLGFIYSRKLQLQFETIWGEEQYQFTLIYILFISNSRLYISLGHTFLSILSYL